jgi:hypothetical protein
VNEEQVIVQGWLNSGSIPPIHVAGVLLVTVLVWVPLEAQLLHVEYVYAVHAGIQDWVNTEVPPTHPDGKALVIVLV